MSVSTKEERREGYAEVPKAFLDEVSQHMLRENGKLEAGEARMEQIEQDLRPIKNMYWAVVGSSIVGTALCALLIYIYAADKNDFKDIQKAIVIQGEAIKGLMVSQSNLEQSYHRDVERIERGQERIYNQGQESPPKRR